MKKSTEERLANIQSDVIKLIKMQSHIFRVLSIVRKTVRLFEAREASATAALVSTESYHRLMNRSWVFIFGALTAISVANSVFAISSIDFTALDFNTKFVLITFYILGVICFAFAGSDYYRARSQSGEVKQELSRIKEVIDVAREEEKTIKDELARVLAEWKELVPDDSVNESKSEN